METNTQKYVLLMGRVETFKDFSINLLYYIDKYYIDYESINTDEDIYNHFTFCYNKVCDEFIMEGINFKDNKELKEYYHKYYYHQYYKSINNDYGTSLEFHEKFWRNIFNIDNQKNKNILALLVEIYLIFDKSINDKKNVLEIV